MAILRKKATTLGTAYLLSSAGFGLALLLFGAVGLFSPIETSLFWGVSALGTVNVTFYLTVLAAYAAYLVFPRQAWRIKAGGDLLLAVALGGLALTAAFTMGGRQEAWFLSFNWLLVNKGYVFGLALGFAVSGVMGSVRLAGSTAEPTRKGSLRPALLTALFAGFGALMFALWRFADVFALTAALFALAALLAAAGLCALLSNKEEPAEKPAPLSKKDRKRLVAAGIFFLLFVGAGVYGLLDKSEILFAPGAPLPGTVRGFQMAVTLLAIAVMLAFAALGKGELKGVHATVAARKGLTGKRAKLAASAPLHSIQSIFSLFAFGTALYAFSLFLYMPQFLLKGLLFTVVGALFYGGMIWAGRQLPRRDWSDWFACFARLLGGCLLLLSIFLALRDSTANGVAYEGYTQPGDWWFPFRYILSWGHAALAGLALGIFITDKLYTRCFRAPADTVSMARAGGLAFGVFALGIVAVGFPHAITMLHGVGKWPPTVGFKVGGLPFAAFFPPLFAGLFALGLLADLLGGLWLRRPTEKNPQAETTAQENAEAAGKSGKIAKKVLALALTVAVLGVAGGAALALLPGARPMLATDSSGPVYYADSYERVTPTARLRPAQNGSEQPAVRVAGNEWGSAQLLWDAREEIQDLRVEVSITGDAGVSIRECSVRLAQNLYEGTFPEILEPVDGQSLPRGKISTFWLSFKTEPGQAPGIYSANVSFTFTVNGEPQSRDISIPVQVDAYDLPKTSHVFYNLPWEETPETTAFYAERRQFMDGGRLMDMLTSPDTWYDKEAGIWDYSRPLDEGQIAHLQTVYGKSAQTGEDVWELFLDVVEDEVVQLHQPHIRTNYLSIILREECGIRNIENWAEGHWTGAAWEESERQILYQFYYTLNQKLLGKPLGKGTLAEWVIVKWKDEFEQPQFFPRSAEGRNMGREELYRLYALELAEMGRARDDALRDAGLTGGGVRYMANVDPVAENMDILFEYFDVYCPLSYRITEPLVEYCHENGKEVWLYTCVQPFLPYANQFAYNQLFETHITQWMLYRFRVDGYWLWRSDRGSHSVYFYGFNGWLDGIFIYYPGGEKPEALVPGSFYTGIRFETATESIEEAELFIMLENVLLDLKARSLLPAEEANGTLQQLQARANSAVQAPSRWTKDADSMKDTVAWARERLALLQGLYDNPTDFAAAAESPWDLGIKAEASQ